MRARSGDYRSLQGPFECVPLLFAAPLPANLLIVALLIAALFLALNLFGRSTRRPLFITGSLLMALITGPYYWPLYYWKLPC